VCGALAGYEAGRTALLSGISGIQKVYMPTGIRKLANPPIVEAVFDIDCEFRDSADISALEDLAKQTYASDYPVFRVRHLLEHQVRDIEGGPLEASFQKNIHSFMFLREDEKELVQVRPQGFSFNRLAPYEDLNGHLAQIETAWRQFMVIAKPNIVTSIRLRYINRIRIPLQDGRVDLEAYLKLGPRLPDEERLAFSGFLNQYVAVEKATGHEVKTVLTSQQAEGNSLPIIFDITVASGESVVPDEWGEIRRIVDSLRDLKNSVFFDSLEDRCLALFQ
jgi:uncharacterized protein (TIGR04255 family)